MKKIAASLIVIAFLLFFGLMLFGSIMCFINGYYGPGIIWLAMFLGFTGVSLIFGPLLLEALNKK